MRKAATMIFIAVVPLLMLAPRQGAATDFTQTLKQIDGKEFSDHATLGMVCESALTADYKDEDSQPPAERAKEKFRRYLLATKIHDHPVDPALSIEDQALLKALVGKAYPTHIMGPAWLMLDPPKNGIDTAAKP